MLLISTRRDSAVASWLLIVCTAPLCCTSGDSSLPVLRVRYGDPQHTWLYFDPRRGVIARKEERLTRLNRWLYHGFHSLDFPFLYYRRPLWDIVVITLSVGGMVLSATTLSASWRRLRRNAGRIGRA